MPPPTKSWWVKNLQACMAICRAFSLTRGDRLEVASIILDQNVESFNDLDDKQLGRVRDALEGAVLVCAIQTERRKGLRV